MTEIMVLPAQQCDINKQSLLIERVGSTMSLSCSDSTEEDHDDVDADHHSSSSLGRRRRVRFTSTVGQVVAHVPAREDYTDSEKAQIYWIQEDINTIRIRAKLNTLDIRKNQPQDIEAIDAVYEHAKQLASPLLSEAEVHDMLDGKLLSQHAQSFRPWCVNALGRGLERYVSSKHRADRGEFTAQARRVVVTMSQSGQSSDADIARAYRQRARPALIFARIAGEADALAAEEACGINQLARQGKQRPGLQRGAASTALAAAPQQEPMQISPRPPRGSTVSAAAAAAGTEGDTVSPARSRMLMRQSGQRFDLPG